MSIRDSHKEKNVKVCTSFMYFMDERIHEYDAQQLHENRIKLYEDLLEEWNLMSEDQKAIHSNAVDFDKKAEIDKAKKILKEHNQRSQITKDAQESAKGDMSETKKLNTKRSGRQKSEEQKDEEREEQMNQLNRQTKTKNSVLARYFKNKKGVGSKKDQSNKTYPKRALSNSKQKQLDQRSQNPTRDDKFCEFNKRHDDDRIICILERMAEQLDS